MLTRRLPVSGPYDLALSMSPLRRGRGDPTQRRAEGGLWRVSRTPEGVATVCLSRVDGDVLCSAWGAGASWMLEQAPALVGLRDDPAGFAPDVPLLHQLHRRHLGLRLPRTGLVLEQLVPAILEQKVTGLEAHRSWSELVRRLGEPAPGPVPPGMMAAPGADVLLDLPTWQWHLAGVDLPRQRAIRAAATVAGRMEECAAMSAADAARRLRLLPGVGVWTAAEVTMRALGDADAVSVGDYHLAGLVGWSLTGVKSDDAAMLELLEPYRPHRQRVVRLLEIGGTYPPRHGPRMSVRSYRGL